MSKHRISPAAGYVGNGSSVLPACRWCKGPIVEKGRRTFCSNPCVHEHRLRSDPGYVRRCVGERDHGVCAGCGRDCVGLKDRIERWVGQPRKLEIDPQCGYGREADLTGDERIRFLRCLGLLRRLRVPLSGADHWSRRLTVHSLWQADHITPVVEGGGECGLDGYRTLCLCCHKHETAELRRRLAKPSGQASGPSPTPATGR